MSLAELLHTRGWVVVAGGTRLTRQDLDEAFQSFPEYADHPSFGQVDGARRYTCGSTSFCGSPSVFWHPVLRELRDMTFLAHREMFLELAVLLGDGDPSAIKISRWFDRVMVRPPGESPSAESWHQDAPAKSQSKVVWTGGWINFDDENQHFKAISGTHTWDAVEGGFKKIAKSQHAEFNAQLKAQAGKPGYNSKGLIVVPPGHLLVFNPTLVHAVNSESKATTSVKAFFGLQFTPSDDPGIFATRGKRRVPLDEIEETMRSNGVPFLPSGQTPPMYPASYLNFLSHLHYYEDFERDMLVPGAMNPLREGNKILHKGHKDYDYTRAMRSLKDQGLPLHAPFHPTELKSMVPSLEPVVLDWVTKEEVVCKRAKP